MKYLYVAVQKFEMKINVQLKLVTKIFATFHCSLIYSLYSLVHCCSYGYLSLIVGTLVYTARDGKQVFRIILFFVSRLVTVIFRIIKY